MNVLVTGATGFIGRRLCQRLYENGHAVTVLSRSGEKAKERFSFPVKAFAWDASKEKAPAAAFEGIDGVIHLAGEGIADKRWTESRKRDLYDSRVKGTARLIETLQALPKKPSVFVSASAIGWYGNRSDEKLDEGSAIGTGFLADICRDWEKATDTLPGGIRLVKIRIGIVLGLEGGALKQLLPIFKLGGGGRVGSGAQWMSWIHVEDLVSLFVHALTHDSVMGVVNGVAPEPVTNGEFSKTLGHVLKRPSFMPTPAFALKLVLGELSALVLDSQRVVSKAAAATGFRFAFTDLAAALHDIVKKKAH